MHMAHALAAWMQALALTAGDRRGQRGQGTVEYVGMVVMVTLLVAGVAVAAKGWAPKIGNELRDGIAGAIDKVTDGFGG